MHFATNAPLYAKAPADGTPTPLRGPVAVTTRAADGELNVVHDYFHGGMEELVTGPGVVTVVVAEISTTVGAGMDGPTAMLAAERYARTDDFPCASCAGSRAHRTLLPLQCAHQLGARSSEAAMRRC